MKVSRTILIRNWFYLIVIMLVGFLFISAFVGILGAYYINNVINEFSQYHLEKKEEAVKTEVQRYIEAIQSEIADRENEKKEGMKMIAKSALTHVRWQLTTYTHEVDEAYISDIIKAYLLDHRDGYDLFFVNKKGRIIYSDIIGISRFEEDSINEQSGFFTYMDEKNQDMYQVYYYFLEGYDLAIGLKYNIDDQEEAMRSSIFDRLQLYYEGVDDYVFIISYDGIGLVTSNKEDQGTDMSKVEDINGEYLHEKFMSVISDESNGYVNYNIVRRGQTNLSEKISYVEGVDEWQTYIAMGFYTDDLRDLMEKYEYEFKKEHYTLMIIITMGQFLLGLFILILILRGANLQVSLLKQEEGIFTQLFQISNQGIIVVSKGGKKLYVNSIIEKMAGGNIDGWVAALVNCEAAGEMKGCQLIGEYERRYYIKVDSQKLLYDGLESKIYFVDDVTEAYLVANESERLAMLDALTGIPNRRSLIKDFERVIEAVNSGYEMALCILDLDLFKRVNDTYGHKKGDQVLKLLTSVFKRSIRSSDTIYRFGGEEFVLILHNISIEDAQNLLNRIKDIYIMEVGKRLGIDSTFSGGIIGVDKGVTMDELDDVIGKADKLLYKAKESGRNKIMTVNDDITQLGGNDEVY